jgi:hypothetical protein
MMDVESVFETLDHINLLTWLPAQENFTEFSHHESLKTYINYSYNLYPPRWLHLIVVRGFQYARDPESYTSGSIATGRASLAGQVKG